MGWVIPPVTIFGPSLGNICVGWVIPHVTNLRPLFGKYKIHNNFFFCFEYAPLGCPPFIGFCSEPRWVFGLAPLSPPISVCLRTPNESPLQGEPCAAPLPTHRQLSHLVPALSLDIQFNADILQLPLIGVIAIGVFILLFCVCLSRASAFHWVLS